MIETINKLELPDDSEFSKIVKRQLPPEDKSLNRSVLPEQFFLEGEHGAVVAEVEGNVDPTPSIEKVFDQARIYSKQIDDFKKMILEGKSPTDAFRALKLPLTPKVKRILLASYLSDEVQTNNFPAAIKKAVLESMTFKMFTDSVARGDDKAAAKWAEVLAKDPAMGMNEKKVSVTVRRDDIKDFLEEPVNVEFLE